MKRRPSNREIEREAYRVVAPLLFWVLAFAQYRMLNGFFAHVPWIHVVSWIAVVALVIAGICYVPRSIRTIRDQ